MLGDLAFSRHDRGREHALDLAVVENADVLVTFKAWAWLVGRIWFVGCDDWDLRGRFRGGRTRTWSVATLSLGIRRTVARGRRPRARDPGP
jgi:hypothetical protein